MRSIKAKLIMLGAVSIVCTIILGLVGIYIMNSNNANNQVLNDINNINLMQNENTTQETSFLYDLDLSHYQTIQTNLSAMEKAAADVLTYSKGEDYDVDLLSVASTIGTVSANTAELNNLLSERGFKSDSGMYNTSLTSETAEVRNKIEELTNTQKLTMSSLIYAVFIVGAVPWRADGQHGCGYHGT